MPELPPDWQDQFMEMVRCAAPPRSEWFAGGPMLDPSEQLAVYCEQYRLRMVAAVRDEVPGLVHVLGDEADALIAAYLLDCPSTSWTLNHVAIRLPEWLEARGAPAVQVDMARVDRAVHRGFDAGQLDGIAAEDIPTIPKLVLQPHVTLLTLRSDVHRVRSKVMEGDEEVEPTAGTWQIVMRRVGRGMIHWEAPAGAFALLQAFEAGLTLPAALERVFGLGLVDITAGGADVQEWFRRIAEKGILGVGQ